MHKGSAMNIYASKAYLVVTFIALSMLALAIINIPHLKLGVEFRGGSLAISDMNSSIDTASLEKDLLANGFADAKILQYKTAVGYRLELEVPLSEEVARAESLNNQIASLMDEYSKSSASDRDNTKLEQAKELLNEMLTMASSNKTATTPAEVLELSQETLNKIRKNYESRLSSILSSYVGIFSIETVTPVLSSSFMEKVKVAAFTSAFLAIVFVFFVFREFAPSMAVIIGALSDIVISLGAMAIFNIPLTLASFAALLMLIGYSLDTDVLLTMRVVKRKDGTKADRAWDALKTGSTMTLTGLLSFSILFLIALFLRIPLYYQIGAVAIAGLVGDLFATWGINAVLLLHATGRKGGVKL
ncbi:MAG: hypothetical protein D6769_01345 [Methanobacteriota archaeon]|nr:MAG: hypothetical protein D6769_01345 [Euryarchaeota archaeon]